MGNCLITKMKGIVNNDSLLKVSEFLVSYDCPVSTELYILGAEDIKLKAKGDLLFTVNGVEYTEYTVPANTQQVITVPSGAHSFTVLDNYGLSKLSLAGLQNVVIDTSIMKYRNLTYFENFFSTGSVYNLADFYDIASLETLNFEGDGGSMATVVGNINEIKSTVLEDLRITSDGITGEASGMPSTSLLRFVCGKNSEVTGTLSDYTRYANLYDLGVSKLITGNISVLSGLPLKRLNIGDNTNIMGTTLNLAAFTDLEDLSFYNTEISGDIANLATLIKARLIQAFYCPNIYGTLESLIAGLRNNGASGTYYFDFGDTAVTYNGQTGPRVTITI